MVLLSNFGSFTREGLVPVLENIGGRFCDVSTTTVGDEEGQDEDSFDMVSDHDE